MALEQVVLVDLYEVSKLLEPETVLIRRKKRSIANQEDKMDLKVKALTAGVTSLTKASDHRIC